MLWRMAITEGTNVNIGQAAEASGVSAKMIRHYESIGVIPAPPRSESGYRRYQASDIQRLSFIRRARAAGFSTPDIKTLISLWQDQQRPAREVKRLASAHLGDIEGRIEELKLIAGALSHLLAHCHGGDRPECPILESLADDLSVGDRVQAPDRLRTRLQAPPRRARKST
jgi:MerR family transcriptional regulator, copper efflux regulator